MPQARLKFVRPQGLSKDQWSLLAGKVLPITRRETPVDTGRLKSSWQERAVTSRSVTVVTNNAIAPYASYVNNGTPKMAGRHFTSKAQVSLAVLAGKMIGKGTNP